jgi:DNA-binding SARP family transcriptional activator
MATLKVRLFGRFSIERADHSLNGLAATKVQELFSYLLTHRRQPVAREVIAGLLWEDAGSGYPKKNLRQALWQLQLALEAGGDHEEPRILVVEPNWVFLNPEAHVWLDVDAFEQAYERCQGKPGEDLDAPSAAELRDAVELYHGDLLEGCYQDWCLFERERLQNLYLGMLDKLMARCLAAGDWEVGIDYGERVLRIDRAHERTHRRLMRLHYVAGDRSAAIQQYERCAEALRADLGVAPANLTITLADQIRADALTAEPEQWWPVPAAPDRLADLNEVRSLLIDLRRQADRGVEAVEHLIRKLA